MKNKFTFSQIVAAWLVHIFTASGAFLGFLALIAYFHTDYQQGTICLTLAVFIDSMDGFFARSARVKEVLPFFDGSLMDNIIDFNIYAFIPLAMLWNTHLVGESWKMPLIVLILLASLYQFCNSRAKTEDHFFLGFPSYWNGLITYLYWLPIPSSMKTAILLFFVVLSFIPLKFLYPTRTYHFRILAIVVPLTGGLIFLYIALFSWITPPLLGLVAIPLLFIFYTILSLIAHKRSLQHD